MKEQKIIDNKYIKDRTLGSGGEGVAYLVLDKDTNLELVAKTIEQEGRKKEKEYVKNEKFEKGIEEAKRMFYKIRSIESPYIIRGITERKGEIRKNNELYKKRQYFIFEYASKGDLWKILSLSGGFEERYSKLIFKKILLGVKALHKAGIYHRDLKIDNIVIDNNYNPKICDFGFATDKKGILTDTCGTRDYNAPQKFEKKVEYSGEKADIFSLGCILFKLVVAGDCFEDKADKDDKYYKYIIEKNKEKYFEVLRAKYEIIESLNYKFKDLHYRMIAYQEDDRPKDIDEILKDKWFDEINDEKQKELEIELKKIFDDKENLIDYHLSIKPDLLHNYGYSSSSYKGEPIIKGKDFTYFKPNFCLENKKIVLNGDYYIKLLGKFDYCDFMNQFVKSILEKYKEPCFIDNIKSNYKCNIKFQKDEEDNEDNEDNENNEDNIDIKKDLIIKLHLYRSGDEELILRFLRKSGDKNEYNEKVIDFISLAKKFNKKDN